MRPTFAIGSFFVGGTMLLAGSLAGGGCTVLTNDAPPDDAGKFEGGGEAGTAACTSCVADQCTGTWALCLTDPACAEAHRCAVAAASDTSRAACVCASSADASLDGEVDAATDAAASSDPRGVYRAFASCSDARTATACKDSCPGDAKPTNVAVCSDEDAGTNEDAGDAGDDAAAGADADTDAGDAAAASDADAGDASPTPKTPTVDTCASCTSKTCGDAKKSCASGTECAAYLECAYVAADAAAADDCVKQHATGQAAAAELADCMRAGCNEACGF